MPKPILSSRSRVTAAQAEKLLKAYAQRLPPAEAARRSGLSLNTAYEQYARIRWRLIEVGYYRDAAFSKDEAGLSESTKEELNRRRGLQPDDVFAHAAEVIEWAEEWPPGTVLRQLRKIIELTGPIDKPLRLSEPQAEVVIAYIRYARAKLIQERARKFVEIGELPSSFAERAAEFQNEAWNNYLNSVKSKARLSK